MVNISHLSADRLVVKWDFKSIDHRAYKCILIKTTKLHVYICNLGSMEKEMLIATLNANKYCTSSCDIFYGFSSFYVFCLLQFQFSAGKCRDTSPMLKLLNSVKIYHTIKLGKSRYDLYWVESTNKANIAFFAWNVALNLVLHASFWLGGHDSKSPGRAVYCYMYSI